MDEID